MRASAKEISFNWWESADKSAKNPPIEEVLLDSSTIYLIASNLMVLVFAVALNWNFILVMLTYWIQSVIIGALNFKRIMALKNFSTKGFYIGKKQAEPTKKTKEFTAYHFAAQYGLFHLLYFGIIIAFAYAGTSEYNQSISLIDVLFVLIAGAVFFANHLFSFKHNKSRKKQNIGVIMQTPYVRIIPIHLTIMFGLFFWLLGAGEIGIVFFMLFKTIADIVMHVIEHWKFE